MQLSSPPQQTFRFLFIYLSPRSLLSTPPPNLFVIVLILHQIDLTSVPALQRFLNCSQSVQRPLWIDGWLWLTCFSFHTLVYVTNVACNILHTACWLCMCLFRLCLAFSAFPMINFDMLLLSINCQHFQRSTAPLAYPSA